MSSNDVVEVLTTALAEATAAVAPLKGVDWLQHSSDTRTQAMLECETLTRTLLAISGSIGISLTEMGEHDLRDRPYKAIADLLRITTAESKRRLARARAVAPRVSLTGEPLPAPMPATATAWHEGQLAGEHLTVISKFLDHLPGDVDPRKVDAAEQYLATQAQELRPEQLVTVADAVDAVLNPDGVLDERPRQKPGMSWTGRKVDGLTKGIIWADAELKAALDTAFSKFARYGATDPFPDPGPAESVPDGQLAFDDDIEAQTGCVAEESVPDNGVESGAESAQGDTADADEAVIGDDQPSTTVPGLGPSTRGAPESASAPAESDPPPAVHDVGPPDRVAANADAGPPGTPSGTVPETLPPDPVRDTRGPAQRRHDALKWLLLGMLGNPALGRHKGLPLTIVVTAAYEQLATLTGTAVTATGDRIPIRTLLRMAAQHGAYHYLSIFHDAQHRELYYGRTRRIATGEQYLTLFGLERGCSFPGCTRPADDCDVHHMSPDWAHGAPTDINGLTLGCTSTHHPAATAGRYTTVRNDDGYTEWRPTPPVADNLPPTPHTPEVTDCHLADRNPFTNDAHHPEKRLAPFLKKLDEIDNPDIDKGANDQEPQQHSPAHDPTGEENQTG